MEIPVQCVEQEYCQAQDKQAFEHGEHHAEKLVQPPEHDYLDTGLDELPQGEQGEYHHNQYDRERHDVQYGRRGPVKPLPHPAAHDGCELEREPYSEHQRNDRDYLGYEAFPQAVDYGGYEANEDYYIQYIHFYKS